MPGGGVSAPSPAFFITFFQSNFYKLFPQFVDYSNFMHPNAHKGIKAWVALHAVPHGGMTNDRNEE